MSKKGTGTAPQKEKQTSLYYVRYNEALGCLYTRDTLSLADGGDLFTFDAAVIDDAIKELYRAGHFRPEMLDEPAGRALIGENFRVLSDGIARGEQLAEASLNHEVPVELSAALDDNALLFAGFKAYHTMNEAGLSLKGADGGIKDFETFKREAAEVFGRQKLNLQSEYRHAVQSAQMAAKWRQIEADGDRYDLQYRTAGDDRVRDEHAALDGVTLPPSDAFWSSYYPPNGWGCRCTAMQVRQGKYPQSDSAEAIARGESATPGAANKIFRFNAGAQKRVFPEKHPNFPKGCGNCTTLKLAFDGSRQICRACKTIGTAKVKVSRDWVRSHFKKELGNGQKTWSIGNGGVDKLNVSYRDIKAITDKPHPRPYARNMAVYHLESASRQSLYLGWTERRDKKKDPQVKGWHYMEVTVLGETFIVVVKEYPDGNKYLSDMLEGESFDRDKIANRV